MRVPTAMADEEDLRRIHPASHLALLGDLAAAGGGHIDADTVVSVSIVS